MKINFKKGATFLRKMYGRMYRAPERIPELIGTEFRHVFTKRYTVLDTCLRILNIRKGLCVDEKRFKDVTGVTPTEFLVGLASHTLRASEIDKVTFIIRKGVNGQKANITAIDSVFFTFMDSKELEEHNGDVKPTDVIDFMEQMEKLSNK